MGRDAEPAVGALVAAMDQTHVSVNIPIVDALVKIGPASVSELTVALRNPAPGIRASATHALGRIRPLPENVASTLLRMAEDEHYEVRQAAVTAMGDLEGPAVAEVLPTLANLLDTPNDLTHDAGSSLGRLGPIAAPILLKTARGRSGLILMGKPGVPLLIQALESDEPNVRFNAASALGGMKDDAAEAVGSLLARVADRNENRTVVDAAEQAIIRMDEAAAHGLADALTSSSERARRFAASRLAVIAMGGKPPFNNLRAALSSHQALTTDRGGEMFDKLRAALSSEDKQVRVYAAVVLGQVTTAPPECVPLLIEALDDQQVRWGAVTALGKMGPDAEAAVPALVIVSKSRSDIIRKAARDALRKINPDS